MITTVLLGLYFRAQPGFVSQSLIPDLLGFLLSVEALNSNTRQEAIFILYQRRKL